LQLREDVDGRDKPGHDKIIGNFSWNNPRRSLTTEPILVADSVSPAAFGHGRAHARGPRFE
jgi:hypothetical protein